MHKQHTNRNAVSRKPNNTRPLTKKTNIPTSNNIPIRSSPIIPTPHVDIGKELHQVTQLAASLQSQLNLRKNYIFYQNAVLPIPREITTVFVIMVGGGGAGAAGYVSNNILYGGGGGGAGAAVVFKPINLDQSDRVLTITVGQGGDANHPDGSPSSVSVNYNGNARVYSALGGKGAVENIGGRGGISSNPAFSGHDGESGEIVPATNKPPNGGSGGYSYFQTQSDANTSSYGIGGAGSPSGVTVVNKGANGFVSIILVY